MNERKKFFKINPWNLRVLDRFSHTLRVKQPLSRPPPLFNPPPLSSIEIYASALSLPDIWYLPQKPIIKHAHEFIRPTEEDSLFFPNGVVFQF